MLDYDCLSVVEGSLRDPVILRVLKGSFGDFWAIAWAFKRDFSFEPFLDDVLKDRFGIFGRLFEHCRRILEGFLKDHFRIFGIFSSDFKPIILRVLNGSFWNFWMIV